MPDTPTHTTRDFGTPEVSLPSAPSVFGRGRVSFFQAQALESTARKNLTTTLEFRDRVSVLTEREKSRVQGSRAINQLTALDPQDPDFLNKRNQIMANNPNAVLDKTAAGFLNLQMDVFNDAEADRDAEAALAQRDRDRRITEETLLRRAQRKQSAADVRAFIQKVDQLGDVGRDSFLRRTDAGMSETDALREAQADEENAIAINQLISQGISNSEIFGTPNAKGELEGGLMRIGTGRLNPTKVAALAGQRKQEDDKKVVLEERREDLEFRGELIADAIERAELAIPIGISPEEATVAAGRLRKLKAEQLRIQNELLGFTEKQALETPTITTSPTSGQSTAPRPLPKRFTDLIPRSGGFPKNG